MPFNNSRINLARQSEFIRQHGENLRYFLAVKCSCTMMQYGSNLPDANRANPNCKACHGIGWIWQDKGFITGLITNVSQNKDLLQSGVAAPGDLVLSPDPRYTISDFDKIQMQWADGIPYEGQLVTRSTGSTDTLNYAILDVISCIQTDPVTGNVTEFKKDIDFTINTTNPSNTITWITGRGPVSGTVYSIKYKALVDWICFAPPQPRRERGTNLGQRVIMRKKHLVSFGV
jgi:hypothetical protein